ncbi:MAG: hypothetical protein JSV35_07450 [Candidatus Bathyarchaeota archaeon]|nr:MAG: hypothetical protein JSV35_07450 [Candidatus Bathyarchaeota archaeon]
MKNVLLQACEELVDDAKTGCSDLVFKEVCLEILSRAKNVLNGEDFKRLVEYASEQMTQEAIVCVDNV